MVENIYMRYPWGLGMLLDTTNLKVHILHN